MSKHLARIGKIDSLVEIPGADKIQTAIIFGLETIVSKSVKAGDIVVFFESGDTQLSQEYCSKNNLFRHAELNEDKTKTGYVSDNGRLKVEKFLKVKSEGLVMPLESLFYTGRTTFSVGDSFDEINKFKICNKYYNEQSLRAMRSGGKSSHKAVETPLFKKHVDTEQLHYYLDSIPIGSYVSLHHKVHGCVKWDTIIETEKNGSLFIRDIVDKKLKVKIKAYDIEKEKEVFVPIDDYYFLENDGEWYEIELDSGEKITITGNNPVWLDRLKCYRRADQLKIGDELLLNH